MKLKVLKFEQEGFLSGLGIMLPEGTILRTHGKLLWVGKKRRDEIVDEFKKFLDTLEASGFDVER